MDALTGHLVDQPGSRHERLQHTAAADGQQSYLQEVLQVPAMADLCDYVGMVVILQEQEQGKPCT